MPEWSLPLDILPTIVVAGQFLLADQAFSTVHQGRTHALHLHGYSAEMEIAGQRLSIAPGDLTISPASLPSRYHLPKPGRHWCIHFHTLAAGGPVVPVALHLPDCAHLRDKFAHASALFATASDDLGHHAARLATLDILMMAARLSQPVPLDDAAARAARFIDDHFAQTIGVAEIAAAAGRSPAYLARVFRQRFGTTLMHRLLQRRAEHARFLLQSTDLPVWRVAERCGVPDAQHFNKFVRHMVGCSPSALRGQVTGGTIDPDR